MPHSFRGSPWLYQRLARSVKSGGSRNDQEKAESWNFFSAKCNVMRVRLHHSLNSPLWSCVSITLSAPSQTRITASCERLPPRQLAICKRFPARIRKGVFENLDGYVLGPKLGRSLGA